MRISIEASYPAAPDRVVAIRLDPDFLAEMSRRTGAVDQTVEASANPDGSGRSVTRRVAPTDDFPDVARRFVGSTIVIVEEVEWAAGSGAIRTARARMHTEGFPVTLEGTIRLTQGGPGSVELTEGDVTAKVPLVGGRIEKAIGPALREAIGVQADTVKDWLARR